ncbi:hypothetical protein M9435_004760 [Picochlorum sp. BPE23]|nr:hypothetical protein M9435_004760 [Picochlorum sp. BPE23]
MIRTSPFVVLTILLGLCSSCLAQRDADDAGDRLLLSVRRPAIVNSTFESLSVGFYTGPNLLPVDYEVKCVAPGSDCQAESLVEPVGGRLPSKVAYITATLFPLESNTTYWCYALSSSDKVTKCQGPLVGTTALPEGALVSYTLQYQQVSSFFNSEKREKVCINLLELSPNGTCAVQDVIDGATRAVNTSLVFGMVDYNEYSEGLLLFDQLSDPTNDTLDVLANGIVNGSSGVDVVDVSIEYVPKLDSPGAPGFVQAPTVGVVNATVTWLDGRVGSPVEDYAVNCVVSSASALCTDAGVNVTGLPRGSETAFVTGLAPNTTYDCWAVASNIAGSICSKEPVAFRTLIEPGPPTNLQENAVSNTSVTIGWVDGLEGNPIETYDVNCVNGTSTSCLSAGLSSLNIPRGSEQGRVSSMIPNTTYECWVIATNEVGNACSSSPVEIKTWIEAGQPTSLTQQAITNSTVTIGWVDGDGGNPEESYSVNCVTGSSPCTSSGISVSNVTRGIQSATVTGLAFNSSYMCYVLAINAVDTVCSSPLSITTTIKPGPPTNVQNPEISTSWAAVTWGDGALGNPEENYTVNCVDSSGSTKCTDSGIQVTDISRGTEFANVTGLDPNTTYSCWVIAENIVGNVCSQLPVTNRTWIQAGEPTSFVQGQIGSTSVEFSWLDGLEGYPSETYSIICTTNTAATDCTNPGGTVVEESGIGAGVENGVVTGLSAGISYKCWAKAVNGAGEVCSDSITLSTTSQLNTKAVIASNQSVSITPDTFAPPSGGSNVTYQVQCLDSSATVCDPQATGTGALQPATPLTDPAAINLAGLTNDVSYQCFSVMSYTDTSSTLKYACSGPIEVKPFAKPVVDKVIAGDQKLTISPIAYTAPSGGSDVKYQVQCLNLTATTCDPLATGIGALQPTSAQSFVSGIPVSDLTNDIPYACFVVVTYTLNSETKYTCSGGAAAAPTASVPTLVPGQVIAGTKKITITPNVFTPPAGTSNVTYQVQCFQVTTNACNLNSALSPSVPLTSPAPIVLTNLNDRSTYSCFSVVSYVLNSSMIYGCSDVYNAVPNTEPQVLTASDVSPASATSADIQVATYTSFAAASNIQYQTQCLSSSATVCNPTVTSGTGAVQPSTASSTSGTFTVPGLTNGTTYQCFSVISYTYSIDSQLKYTCSAPYEYLFIGS